MFGCSSEAASRASALKRATAFSFCVCSGAMIFSATVAVEVGVRRLVDDAHAPAIEQALDPVAGEHGAVLEAWQRPLRPASDVPQADPPPWDRGPCVSRSAAQRTRQSRPLESRL